MKYTGVSRLAAQVVCLPRFCTALVLLLPFTLMSLGTLRDNMRLEEASQTNSVPSLRALGSEIKWECIRFVFWDRASLRSPGCPGTHCVNQASLELPEIHCLCPPSAGITGMYHHTPQGYFFIFKQCFGCILVSSWPPAESLEGNLPIFPTFYFYDDNQSWPEEHNL